MANIGQSTQGTYVNGANHGRVQQDWVGEGSSKEAFTQGFGMFDAEQDTHNCDFGNTHRKMEVQRVAGEAKAIKNKQRLGGCPFGNSDNARQPEAGLDTQRSDASQVSNASLGSNARGMNPERLAVYKSSMGESRHTSCANHVTTSEQTTANFKEAQKRRNDNLQKQRGNSNLLAFE